MTDAFIALGSNVGDREAHLAAALEKLCGLPGTRVLKISRWIETEPQGGPPQPPFLNGAAEIQTALEPRALLERLQQIERELGRPADHPRWAARTIDLDILSYGHTIIDEPGLTIPHPLMHERRFALEPMAEIAPDWIHPVFHQSARELLDHAHR